MTRVLQFYSKILLGNAQRLIILFTLGGFRSFDEWAAARPELLWKLRVGVVQAASWVYRRFRILAWPWRLAQLVDPRVAVESRRNIGEEFVAFPMNQLDTYFSQRVRRLLAEHPDRDLMSAFWNKVLLSWGHSVLLSIAPVEFVHGRNRRRSNRDTCWTTFVANYLLQEGKLHFDTLAEELPADADIAPHGVLVESDVARTMVKGFRKQSALTVFCREYAAQQCAIGRRFNWIRQMVECKEKYSELTDPRREIYEEQAALSLSASDARALGMQHQVALPLPAPVDAIVPMRAAIELQDEMR